MHLFAWLQDALVWVAKRLSYVIDSYDDAYIAIGALMVLVGLAVLWYLWRRQRQDARKVGL